MNSYASYHDGELLSLLKTGDETAFTELYNRYWESLLAVAFSKLHNTSDAKEAVQQVFIQLWTRRENLDIKYKIYTYLSAAVRYQVINILQQQYKSVNNIQPSGEDPAHDWLNTFELAEQLEKSIGQLPEKCQLIFRLSKQQGFSQKEISATLDISEKTVEAHLSKAHRLLRVSLKQFFSLFI